MAGHERDDVTAAHGVPAGQPVRADASLERRQPRHQPDKDDEGVPGQQAQDAAHLGKHRSRAAHAGRVVPPQGKHGDRPQPDDPQDQAGKSRAAEPAGL
jgi:hypothetical protein